MLSNCLTKFILTFAVSLASIIKTNDEEASSNIFDDLISSEDVNNMKYSSSDCEENSKVASKLTQDCKRHLSKPNNFQSIDVKKKKCILSYKEHLKNK